MKISDGSTKNKGSKTKDDDKNKSENKTVRGSGMKVSKQNANKESNATAQVMPSSSANVSLRKLLDKSEGAAKITFKKTLPANTNALKNKYTKKAFLHYVTKK